MKVVLRWRLAGFVTLAVLVALVVIEWPNHSGPYAEGPASPRLAVLRGWTEGGPYMSMHGDLGVNARHCVTLAGDVMVAQEGTRVSPDGNHVTFPGHAPLKIGTSLEGAGGIVGRQWWLRHEAPGMWDDDLVHALGHCLGDDQVASIVQFWLPQD